tara:strand:- start:1790 stop:2113 length:324 start_codon:yes stop_codon:yes gene_type:complete
MRKDLIQAIIIILAFALSCYAYLDNTHYDLFKLLFELAFPCVYLIHVRHSRVLTYITMTVIVGILYALGKELLGVGAVSYKLDLVVEIGVIITLITLLIIQFVKNAK